MRSYWPQPLTVAAHQVGAWDLDRRIPTAWPDLEYAVHQEARTVMVRVGNLWVTAHAGDWLVRCPDGTVGVVTNSLFAVLFEQVP